MWRCTTKTSPRGVCVRCWAASQVLGCWVGCISATACIAPSRYSAPTPCTIPTGVRGRLAACVGRGRRKCAASTCDVHVCVCACSHGLFVCWWWCGGFHQFNVERREVAERRFVFFFCCCWCWFGRFYCSRLVPFLSQLSLIIIVIIIYVCSEYCVGHLSVAKLLHKLTLESSDFS